MIVTFCGHREISDSTAVQSWLQSVVRDLIENGAKTFYLGGYGAFDQMAASVVREQKKAHTNLEMVLVLPYLNSNMDTSGYDSTVYPPLETVPLRYAISKRNQYMVEQADVVVAYVTHGWGGAAQTLSYARRKKKRIVLFSTK